VMCSLSASDMSWQLFTDTIKSDPKTYCHKSYPSDLFVKLGNKKGVPSCGNYGSGMISANVKVPLNKKIVINKEMMGVFVSTASKIGFIQKNCSPFKGGMVCKSNYNGYSVFWRMIEGKDYLSFEISNI